MVTYKNITKIVGVIVAAAVLLCILAVAFPEKVAETFGEGGVALRYESELFDTGQIMEIDIQMDEGEWEDMIAHAAEESYYSCDVVINGEKIHNVGVRPKGNTSLSSIVMDPDTDRFSLKLEFDHYVEGQTCFGLDKLILNNNYADATNMKEALVYDMYRYLETDASLYNYAKISVNGEYWGVYLALEAVEDSFQLRNYGTADGKLYKPESMGMGGGSNGGGPGGERPSFGEGRGGFGGGSPEMPDDQNFREAKGNGQSDKENPHDRDKMPEGGHSMGGSGADLNYTNDDLDSYSTIWEGEVTNTGKNDHRRVVTALKNISEGNQLEKYMDVDNVLKYMAVHVFSVNMDSLSGVMAHNYYLYEHNGQLNILPWDYNLSFGGMGMGAGSDASGVVNDAVDTPFQATEFFDGLLEDEAYLARYHEYLRQLVEVYIFGGRFEEFYNRVQDQISALVETDPTAFYPFEEYEAAAGMLYKTVMLRAESIRGQLDGTIPSTDEGQRADSSSLVDASDVDIEVMGVFNGGGRGRNDDENRFFGHGDNTERESNQEMDGEGKRERQEGEPVQEAFNSGPAMPGGENGGPGGPPQGFGGPGDGNMAGGPGGGNSRNMAGNLVICGICFLAAVLALAMVKGYERIPQKKQIFRNSDEKK